MEYDPAGHGEQSASDDRAAPAQRHSGHTQKAKDLDGHGELSASDYRGACVDMHSEHA